jgi:hypothetical protein
MDRGTGTEAHFSHVYVYEYVLTESNILRHIEIYHIWC